eukprot:scaffold300640_cov20-Prasinocladus_malaysianus.AAC.1
MGCSDRSQPPVVYSYCTCAGAEIAFVGRSVASLLQHIYKLSVSHNHNIQLTKFTCTASDGRRAPVYSLCGKYVSEVYVLLSWRNDMRGIEHTASYH